MPEINQLPPKNIKISKPLFVCTVISVICTVVLFYAALSGTSGLIYGLVFMMALFCGIFIFIIGLVMGLQNKTKSKKIMLLLISLSWGVSFILAIYYMKHYFTCC
jgi:hypothetical protein